ncbi:hypothetical protein FWF48_03320 [Candidatus Saccharibacteria bacterium]|nr:hypothetical protein [Candidatus Saccharibacteria bacterium]
MKKQYALAELDRIGRRHQAMVWSKDGHDNEMAQPYCLCGTVGVLLEMIGDREIAEKVQNNIGDPLTCLSWLCPGLYL